MKKFILLLVMFAAMSTYAQSVGVIYENEEVTDTLLLPITDLENFNVIYFDLFNKSSRDENVRIRKEEVFVLEDSYNSFCFGENCYDNPEPEETIEILAGDTFSFAEQGEHAFHISYFANGKIGKSVILYTFYNAEMTEDAHTITVIFDSESPLAIHEQAAKSAIEIFPNPTYDKIYLKQDQTGATATLSTLDGRRVRNWPTIQDNTLDISDLSNGVYLLTVQNGLEQKSVKIVKR